MSNLDKTRHVILARALVHVVFDGWSWKALKAAAKDANIDPIMLKRAFPKGPRDLVYYFSESADKLMLEELGYDTHMVYVNTSLDVALARNAQRDRSVAEPVVVKSWKDVQANIGTFSQAFRGRFIVVDNNDPLETMKKDIFPKIWKLIRGQLKKKVANTRAKNWMAMELAKKTR